MTKFTVHRANLSASNGRVYPVAGLVASYESERVSVDMLCFCEWKYKRDTKGHHAARNDDL